MKLDPRQQIAGHDAKTIRNLLKRRDYLSVQYVQDRLGISAAEAGRTLEGLSSAGFLEPGSGGVYSITPDGHQLGNASFVKRIRRSRANQLLAEILQRAEEINLRTDLTHRIDQIDVFGSYLTDSEDLGDLDIAVSLSVRPEYAHNFVEISFARARDSGRRLTLIEQLGFSEHEVLGLLKGKRRSISIHNFSQLELSCCRF